MKSLKELHDMIALLKAEGVHAPMCDALFELLEHVETLETVDLPVVTLRDHFAGLALADAVRHTGIGTTYGDLPLRQLCEHAYRVADRMIIAREWHSESCHACRRPENRLT